MLVTDIKEKGKNLAIYIDGEFAFVLSKADAQYFKLKEGAEIPREKYDYISESLVYIDAQNTALKFLASKMRTSQEIVKKLAEKDYADEVIEKVTAFLEKYNYTDDEKYCEAYIRDCQKLKPRGRRAIIYELKQKGVAEEKILTALDNVNYDETDTAKSALEKKLKGGAPDQKQKQKLFAALERKGFSYDAIKEAFNSLLNDEG